MIADLFVFDIMMFLSYTPNGQVSGIPERTDGNMISVQLIRRIVSSKKDLFQAKKNDSRQTSL
ncbi:MAG: hypothetical protein DI535_17715 [Citrobacter freundii]|nr:MAG: hypothetical protein DI535_17715 [Citrobacter freundii]